MPEPVKIIDGNLRCYSFVNSVGFEKRPFKLTGGAINPISRT